MPGLQLRGIRGGLRQGEDGQWLTFVDIEGATWLAWAPTARWDDRTEGRFSRVNALLKKQAEDERIPFIAAQPVASVVRHGGGIAIVFTHPGGRELSSDDLSRAGLLPKSLGVALAALHELPADEYAHAARQRASADVTRTALRQLVATHASAIPARLRARWTGAIDEDSLWTFNPVPLHGSLTPSSVYAAPGGAVVGMAPFDAAAVGDPAQDLIWLMYHADDEFLQTFEASYSRARRQSDLHLLTRAQLLSELETLRWYARAVQAEDRAWRREGITALRELDEEIGDQLLVAARPEVVEITFTAKDEPLMKLQPREWSSQAGPSWEDDERPVSSGDMYAGPDSDTDTEVISAVCDLPTGPFAGTPGTRGASTVSAASADERAGGESPGEWEDSGPSDGAAPDAEALPDERSGSIELP